MDKILGANKKHGTFSLKESQFINVLLVGLLLGVYCYLLLYMVVVTNSDFARSANIWKLLPEEIFYGFLYSGTLLGPLLLFSGHNGQHVSRIAFFFSAGCLFYLVWSSPLF